MMNFLFVCLLATCLLSEDSKSNYSIPTRLELFSKGESLIAKLTISNNTGQKLFLPEEYFGFCDAENLINSFNIINEKGEKIDYIGLIDNELSSGFYLEPGKDMELHYVLNSMYDLRNINGNIEVYFHRFLFDDNIDQISYESNAVKYRVSLFPFIERKNLNFKYCTK